MTDLFLPLTGETRNSLSRLMVCIDETFPLQKRFRADLAGNIAELSRLLTSTRDRRDDGYMGRPALLSAYLRYFLPWNAYRLARLLPALPINLKPGDTVTDLGSGPLTVPIALWISRPDLRKIPLEFRCLDRTGGVLGAGVKLLHAVAGADSPWTVKTTRASLGARIDGPPAALVTAANVFNEVFWDDRRMLKGIAEKQARFLSAIAREDGAVLVVEPGIPRSGEFISALRTALAGHRRMPAAPCPHSGVCPLPGGGRGAKWCHFAFDTDGAPGDLLRLSAAAGIPKERAVLSFLYTGSSGGALCPEDKAGGAQRLPVRVITDPFPVAGSSGVSNNPGKKSAPHGNRFGRYGCSRKGLVLVTGSRGRIEDLPSGSCADVVCTGREPRDSKSGALVFPLE
ncbi:small ribosomal subunit Rsm22 family protein [Breznakiella homolactica]|uniref:rRNA methyltransferase n=1 Tax=Breznakiella homolactica TaxID=2798577 RepID=A0A7T7XQC4_9SPIR|nr:small ribosomal subunit Rsm22 family protein [Breznakiella homolactica]QQO10542.1 rRNA methyltransferase [Breznakiella homolactica]